MRWASKGNDVCLRAAAMTDGPNVRLGTNWPSITSHWILSTPAASSAATSSPSLAKSAGSTLGAISIGRGIDIEGTGWRGRWRTYSRGDVVDRGARREDGGRRRRDRPAAGR